MFADQTRRVAQGVVSAHAFTRHGSADDEAALAAGFASSRAINLPGFLAPELLRQLGGLWQGADFVPEIVGKFGNRTVETPARAAAVIRFVLGRPTLYRWLEQLTGCRALGGATGDVVQMRPVEDEQLTWHNDLNDPNRVLGVTVNLGEVAYRGGDFEMRRKGEAALCCRHHHSAPGEALVFEVSSAVEHRVTPVIEGGPRTIFAGWFVAA